MKKILTILLAIITQGVHAQTWEEWTQQKKTQIKYLEGQIAALQAYLSYAEKGYAIAKAGLTAIHDIKNGDIALHKQYFTSLKKVNPKIRSYWKIADIIALQIKIAQSCHGQRNAARQSGRFSAGEISYLNSVFANLLNRCADIIDQLILIETDGSLLMTDDKRIKRIDVLHADMKDKYVFIQHFNSEANGLTAMRLLDANDVRTGRALLNISK